jgi:hypothetical protein
MRRGASKVFEINAPGIVRCGFNTIEKIINPPNPLSRGIHINLLPRN